MLLFETPVVPIQSYLRYPNQIIRAGAVIQDVQSTQNENINISDVIEVIQTDQHFTESPSAINGNENTLQSPNPPLEDIPRQAYVRIVEQPASRALKFRYESELSEGKSAGSIPGATSTPENKTFPSIQVMGYTGRAIVVVSCVTTDHPYKPHPHNLVGKNGCKKGVCSLEISPETMTVEFSNLGIQCTRKKDIKSALRIRREIRVDPFRTGFSHNKEPSSIDLNAVRLCFQVFLGNEKGEFNHALTPVVSEPIYAKKTCDPSIVKLSDCVSYVDGGRKDIILLCEKVEADDIQIRFFEEKDGQVIWEDYGDFKPSQVHKQTAIWFKAPRYKTSEVTEPVKVYIQLRRLSDSVSSKPIPFELLPSDPDTSLLKRKRKNFQDPNKILRQLQEHNNINQQPCLLNMSPEIKPVLRDTTQSPFCGQTYDDGISQMYSENPTVSPQYQSISPSVASADIQYALNYQPPRPNLNSTPLPPIGSVMQSNWAIQSLQASAATNIPNHLNVNMDASSSDVYSFFNLNRQTQPTLTSTNTNNNVNVNLDASTSSSCSFFNLTQAATTTNLSNNLSVNIDTSTSNNCNFFNLDSGAPQAPIATNIPNNLSVNLDPSTSTNGDCNIFNLDSRELVQLNSTELTDLNIFEIQNLSETFSTNLSLTDESDDEDKNISDRITRLANNTIENICQLNNMIKQPSRKQ